MKFYTYGLPIKTLDCKYKNGQLMQFGPRERYSNYDIINSFPLDIPDTCRLFETEKEAYLYAEYIDKKDTKKGEFIVSTKHRAIFTIEYEGEVDTQKWQSENIKAWITKFDGPYNWKRTPCHTEEIDATVKYFDIYRDKIKLLYGTLKVACPLYDDPEYMRTLQEYHYTGWNLNCTMM